MGIRGFVDKEVRAFREGWASAEDRHDDRHSDGPVFGAKADLVVGLLVTASRVVLFGFLLARPGVPFLPHDQPLALSLTVVAGLLAAAPLRPEQARPRLLTALVTIAIVGVTLRIDDPTTSIVLVGAAVSALARAADSYPMLYGVVAGMAIMATATQVWDLTWFTTEELLLSGQRGTPDQAGHESLLLAGFLFVAALLNFVRHDMERLRTKALAAEAERDAAVADERARIARELHDVVSHHVTAMTLQAEAAAMTGDKQALTSVAGAGREALTELRRMLGVLRRPDAEPSDVLDPQPGLHQLDALAQRTRSGPTVRIERRGDVRPLSAGLELGVYRLVQEALTNSAKHSDASTVDVVLTYGESELRVDVRDNGRPLVAARLGSGGLGLVGMRERIALLNGTLEVGPRDDAPGFRVGATMPIDA